MDIELHSKPHTIRGFRIELPFKNVPAPDWLLAAYKRGEAFCTCNSKDNYITLRKEGGFIRGYVGQWLCINESGTLFFLTQEEVDRGFVQEKEVQQA